MMIRFSFFCLVFALLSSDPWAHARSSLVFMQESEAEGRQIILTDARALHHRPLTSGTDWNLYPAITADGKTVAYVTGKGAGQLQVVTLQLDSNQYRQWTRTAGSYLHPDFSGDGKFLAYSGATALDAKASIFIQSTERPSEPAEQITLEDSLYFPTLSSDGSFLLFQRTKAGGLKDIVSYNRAEKTITPLTDPQGISMAPSLSFDERWVAYTSKVNENWDVYVQNLETHQVYRVTHDAQSDFAPSFTPEGHLVFASNRTGSFALYQVDRSDLLTSLTEEKSRLLTRMDGDLYAPKFSGNTQVGQKVLPAIPNPARSSFGAVTHQGKVYIAGGHQGPEHTYPPESFVDQAEAFDLETQTWAPLAKRSIAAQGFGMAADGDFVYAFGGFTYSADHKPGWKSIDLIERYDIKDNRWEVVGHLPHPRSSNVTIQIKDKVYLIGGWNSTPKFSGDTNGEFHRTIDVFDLKTQTVSTLDTSLPNPLRRAFTGVAHGSKILLLGGISEGSSHFSLLKNVTSYDTETGQWQEMADLPFATFAPAAEILGNQLYIFGGMTQLGEFNYNYINHIFTTSMRDMGNWTHTGRYLTENKGFSSVVHLNGSTLGILGGHSYDHDQDAPVATFETFEGLSEK